MPYIPEADYDHYAGQVDKKLQEQFTYYDYTNVTDLVTNEDAINNSIKNILMTRIGSLPGKPDFGSNVMSSVFELMDNSTTIDLLRNSIIYALMKWEPRITLSDIQIKEMPEYNKIVSSITYSYNIFGNNIDAKTEIVLTD